MSKPSLFLCGLVVLALILVGSGLGIAYFDTKTIYGKITDAHAAPIASAAVTLAGRSTFSDSFGKFEIQIPRGVWDLHAFADGYDDAEQSIHADDFFQQNFSTALALEPKKWRARVVADGTQKPIANARVEFDDQIVTTDAQGEFTAQGVRNGTKLKITEPGYRPVTVTVQSTGNSTDIAIITLTPSELKVTVVDAVSNKPLPDISVTANGVSFKTDANGSVILPGITSDTEISVQQPGYSALMEKAGSASEITFRLQPTSLQGRAIDFASKAAIADAVVLIAGSDGKLTPALQTDAQGKFGLTDFSRVKTLYIKKPGYLFGTFDLTHGGAQDFALTPFQVQGIHLYYGIKRADAERVLTQLKNTELNAVVFDVKEDPGFVLWDSQVLLAKKIGAYTARTYTAQDEVATCRAFKLYCIARLTVFKDKLLAQKRPDLALHDTSGALLFDNSSYWTNPAKKEVQDYHIGLAQELVAMGFDEVQFDYIRYPGTRAVDPKEFGDADARVKTIHDFLARAADALRPTTSFFSGDVFGLTTAVDDEQGIGQVWEKIVPAFDYISPMMYPSTWRYATDLWGKGFGIHDCTDAYTCPYAIIRYGTEKAKARTDNTWTLIRPWLQAYGFGLDQFLAQARGASDANSAGYLFWNNLGVYPDGLFKKAAGSK